MPDSVTVLRLKGWNANVDVAGLHKSVIMK